MPFEAYFKAFGHKNWLKNMVNQNLEGRAPAALPMDPQLLLDNSKGNTEFNWTEN